MSDDDFMCEDEEDYGLVSRWADFDPFSQCRHFFIVFFAEPGIFRGFQLRTGCGSRESILQQQGAEGGDAQGCARVVPEGAGSRK